MVGMGGGGGGLGSVWASVGLNTGPLAAGIGQAQGMMKGLDASMTASASKATFTASSIMAGFAKIGKVGVAAAAVIGVASVKMAADFDESLRKAGAVAEATNAQMASWGETVLEMSTRFPKSAQDIAEAFYWIKSDMPDATDAEQFATLETAIKGSVGGVAELGDATEALIVVQNAYAESGAKLQGPTDYMDAMNVAVQRGSVTLQDLIANMGKVSSAAAMANIPFTEIMAAAATLTKVGVEPATAFMALNQTIMSFLKPTDQAKEAAQGVGIELSLAALRSKGLAGAMMELATKVPDDKLTDLFENIRALKGVIPLASVNTATFAADLAAMGDRAGTTDKMFGIVAEGLKSKFTVALNELKKTLIELGGKIMPYAENAIAAFGRIVGGENEAFNTFGRFLKSAASAAVNFASALVSVAPAIYGVVGALAALKLVGLFSTGASSIAGGFTALRTTIGAAAPVLLTSSGLITGVGVAGIAAAVGIGVMIAELKKTGDEAQATFEAHNKIIETHGNLAQSTLPLIAKLDALRAKQAEVEKGTEEYAATAREITDVQNQIAGNFPSLIAAYDAESNALTINTEAMRDNMIQRMARAGISITPDAPPEFQDVEAALGQLEKTSGRVEKMDMQILQLRNALGEAGVEWQELNDIEDAWAISAEAGSIVTLDLMNRISGKISTDEFARLGIMVNTLNMETTKWGGNITALRTKVGELTPAFQAVVGNMKTAALTAGQAGKEIPQFIIKAFADSRPELNEAGVQSMSQYLQGIDASIGPEVADNVAQQLFPYGVFTQTASEAVNAALAAMQAQINAANLSKLSGIIVEAFKPPSAAPAETKVDVKAPGADRVQEVLDGILNTAKDVDSTDPTSEVSTPGAGEAVVALSQIWGMANMIPRNITISAKVQLIGSGPFTVKEYVNYLTRSISEASPSVTVLAGMGGGELPYFPRFGELADEMEGLDKAWASVTAGFQKSFVGELTGDILTMKTSLAELTNTNWDVVASQDATIAAWEKEAKEVEIMRLRAAMAGDEAGEKALADRKAALDNAIALERTQQELNQTAAASAGLNTETSALVNAWIAAKTALKGYSDQITAHEDNINVLSHAQELLNRQITKHQDILSKLQQTKIAGEGARADRSFKYQSDINKLQLDILKAQAEGRFNDAAKLAADKAKLEKAKEIYDLETGVKYDEKKRALEKLLDPMHGQEMSYARLKKAIKAEIDILGEPGKPKTLRGRLHKIEKQIERERDAVWELKVEFDKAVTHVQNYENAINNLHSNFMEKYREMIAAQEELNRAMGEGAGGGGEKAGAGRTATYLGIGGGGGGGRTAAGVTNASHVYNFDQLVLPNVTDYPSLKRDLANARLRMAVPS